MKRRFIFWITEQQIDSLQALKESTGLAIGEIIRRAIDEYLERLKLKKTNWRK